MGAITNFFNRLTKRQYLPAQRSITGFSAGSYVSEESAKQVAAYYRGLTYISTQIAKLPLEIKDRKNNSDYGAIFKLLNIAPNKEMNAFVFKVSIIQNSINTGNGYAEIERDFLGRPVALHLIDPYGVTKVRNEITGEIAYRVDGTHTVSGQTVYLPPKDVLHIPNFCTANGQIGQGLVHYARTVLGIAISADKFAGAMYENSGMVTGVLEVPGHLSDEAFSRLKEDWKSNHGGKKTGGTAILEEGTKFNAISLSPDVLQFLESRKFSVLEVARFLGLPPTKLFDGDSATYNNIEHSNLEVALDTLDAWARNLESEIDVKLLNSLSGDKYSQFDMYAIFRGDMKTRAEYFNKMMQNGAITPNEIRSKEGMAPYEGGDRFYIAVNNFTPSDRVDEVIDAQVSSKSGETEKEDTAEDDKEDENEKELQAVAIDFLKRRTKN